MFAFAGVVVKTGVIIMNTKTNLPDAMALKLQGLCDMLELIKPLLDALPENKRRDVPGLNWIQSAINDAREIRQEYVDSKHGAMFAPKAVNREPDGEILYA